jgi:hypothetical protein
MKCEKCGEEIGIGEEREHGGRTLCEDCFMDVLSPARTCDPWAVHSAKSSLKQEGLPPALNPTQKKILDVLEETGGIELGALCERLQMKAADLEREIAALRHMEKIRGELRERKKLIRLW